jgi:hypothetical protein
MLLCPQTSCCFGVIKRIKEYAAYFFNVLHTCVANILHLFYDRQIEVQSVAPIIQEDTISMTEDEARELWNEQMNVPIIKLVDAAFAPSMVNLVSKNAPAIAGICSPVRLATIPHIGIYGDCYRMANVHLVVRLPKRQLAAFPKAIQSALRNYSESQLDLYFIVYNDDVLCRTQNGVSRNLIYHCCCYPQLGNEEVQMADHEMGLFECTIKEIDHSLRLDTISINCFGRQTVHFHPIVGLTGKEMAISPNNARFNIDKSKAYDSFYSACKLQNHRAVAFFGVIIHNAQSIEGQTLLAKTASLREYKENLIKLQESSLDLHQKIDRLLTFQEVDNLLSNQ